MRKKIFQNYLLVGFLVMVLCCGLFLGVLFQRYEEQAFEQLSAEAGYIAHGMDLSGEAYLETMGTEARVTWVDTDGDVLYDSAADPSTMENHLDREEIAQALEEARMAQSLSPGDPRLAGNAALLARMAEENRT